MQKAELYHLLNNLLKSDQTVSKKERFGIFTYVPPGNIQTFHTLQMAHKGKYPSSQENEVLLETLRLWLRNQTRQTGWVLCQDIVFNPYQKKGIFGASTATWVTTSPAYLLNLRRDEEVTVCWWLNHVQETKKADAEEIAKISTKLNRPYVWKTNKLL